MAFHCSTPAWKISWMEEPGGLQSMQLLRVRHDWATSLSLFTCMHWRRKWLLTPVFLPWRIPGTGEPGGLPSTGSHRVGHDWSDLAAVAAAAGSNMVIYQNEGKGAKLLRGSDTQLYLLQLKISSQVSCRAAIGVSMFYPLGYRVWRDLKTTAPESC